MKRIIIDTEIKALQDRIPSAGTDEYRILLERIDLLLDEKDELDEQDE